MKKERVPRLESVCSLSVSAFTLLVERIKYTRSTDWQKICATHPKVFFQNRWRKKLRGMAKSVFTSTTVSICSALAPSRMASVNLPLHDKVQKFSSGTGSPGWSQKKGRKTVVLSVWCLYQGTYSNMTVVFHTFPGQNYVFSYTFQGLFPYFSIPMIIFQTFQGLENFPRFFSKLFQDLNEPCYM